VDGQNREGYHCRMPSPQSLARQRRGNGCHAISGRGTQRPVTRCFNATVLSLALQKEAGSGGCSSRTMRPSGMARSAENVNGRTGSAGRGEIRHAISSTQRAKPRVAREPFAPVSGLN